jgi:CDP-diacylglycerol---glycerol-3-phosphate 3-phosphatidyltransferase
MNLSNKLTLSRMGLTFVLMFLLFQTSWIYLFSALCVFILASLTDVWDGQIARARGEFTDFGRLMDPIADKILVLSCFFVFLELKLVFAWMVTVIVIRELLVTGLRMLALSKGVVLSADRWGKHKAVSQIVAILIILIFLVIRAAYQEGMWGISQNIPECFPPIILAVMWVAVASTLISGLRYFQINWGILSQNERRPS